MDDFLDLTARITSLLEGLQINYHITGGLASSYHGDPRYTQDIDLVLIVEPEKQQALLGELSKTSFLDLELWQEALKKQGIAQALDQETAIKIDFHFGEAVPNELARSIKAELSPELTVKMVSLEDAILSKLLWIKKGSSRGADDVQAMLETNPEIDRSSLSSKANKIGVQDILESLLK